MLGLRYPDGKLYEVYVDHRVRNLAQVKAGDVVKVEYNRGLIFALKSSDNEARERHEKVTMERAELGEKPSGSVERVIHASGLVQAVDMTNQSVTLLGAVQTVTLPVAEDVNLKDVRVGDKVKAKYIETTAGSVEAASSSQ